MSNELLFVIPGFYCENGKTLDDSDAQIIEVLDEDDNKDNYFKIRGSSKSLHENEILDGYYRVEIAASKALMKKPKKIDLGNIEDLEIEENQVIENYNEPQVIENYNEPQAINEIQQKTVNIPVVKQISFEEELVNKLIETQTDTIKQYSIKIELPFDVISISAMLKNFNINEKQALEIMMKNTKFQQAVLNSLVSIFDSDKVELNKVIEVEKVEVEKTETLVNMVVENKLNEINDKLDELVYKSRKLDEIQNFLTNIPSEIEPITENIVEPVFQNLPIVDEIQINNRKFNPIIEKYLNLNN